MKNVILLTAFLAFTTSFALAQNIKKLDEKNGFKDLTLGATYEQAKKYLSDLPTESNVKEKTAKYLVTDASFLEVGESKIDNIVAVFFNDKLESIQVATKGLENFKNLLAVLSQGYGKGEKKNTYIDEYHWLGKKVTMSYKLNAATKDAKLSIISKEILELSGKYKKEVKKGVINEL